MTTEIDLLPLPKWMSNYTIPADDFECDKGVMLVDRMHDYARANVARAIAAKDAEIDTLRTRLEDTVRDSTNKIEALRTEAEQHLRQAMSNGAKARAAQARAERLAEALGAYQTAVNKIDDLIEYSLPMPPETKAALYAILDDLTEELAKENKA